MIEYFRNRTRAERRAFALDADHDVELRQTSKNKYRLYTDSSIPMTPPGFRIFSNLMLLLALLMGVCSTAAADTALVPAGTALHVRLAESASSRDLLPGAIVRAKLAAALLDGRNTIVLPAGTPVRLRVTRATSATPDTGAELALEVLTVDVDGVAVPATSTQYAFYGRSYYRSAANRRHQSISGILARLGSHQLASASGVVDTIGQQRSSVRHEDVSLLRDDLIPLALTTPLLVPK